MSTTNPILTAFLRIFTSVLKGNQLANPALWKWVQQAVNSLIVAAPFLASIFPAYGVFLEEGFLLKVVAILGTLSVYFTTATTNKIGL